MDKQKVEWLSKDGSIFTKDTVPLKSGPGAGKIILVPESVAFNVGQEIADHLVKLHNDHLHLCKGQ